MMEDQELYVAALLLNLCAWWSPLKSGLLRRHTEGQGEAQASQAADKVTVGRGQVPAVAGGGQQTEHQAQEQEHREAEE